VGNRARASADRPSLSTLRAAPDRRSFGSGRGLFLFCSTGLPLRSWLNSARYSPHRIRSPGFIRGNPNSASVASGIRPRSRSPCPSADRPSPVLHTSIWHRIGDSSSRDSRSRRAAGIDLDAVVIFHLMVAEVHLDAVLENQVSLVAERIERYDIGVFDAECEVQKIIVAKGQEFRLPARCLSSKEKRSDAPRSPATTPARPNRPSMLTSACGRWGRGYVASLGQRMACAFVMPARRKAAAPRIAGREARPVRRRSRQLGRKLPIANRLFILAAFSLLST